MSPIYDFVCDICKQKREQYGSIMQRIPVVKCPKCKKKMHLSISGGTDVFGSKKPVSMGAKTLGSLVSKNTDKMSLDEKIYHGTKKYQDLNPNIKPEIAEQDRKTKIEKETQKIIRGHKS